MCQTISQGIVLTPRVRCTDEFPVHCVQILLEFVLLDQELGRFAVLVVAKGRVESHDSRCAARRYHDGDRYGHERRVKHGHGHDNGRGHGKYASRDDD
jgi:hypothetical protein